MGDPSGTCGRRGRGGGGELARFCPEKKCEKGERGVGKADYSSYCGGAWRMKAHDVLASRWSSMGFGFVLGFCWMWDVGCRLVRLGRGGVVLGSALMVVIC